LSESKECIGETTVVKKEPAKPKELAKPIEPAKPKLTKDIKKGTDSTGKGDVYLKECEVICNEEDTDGLIC